MPGPFTRTLEKRGRQTDGGRVLRCRHYLSSAGFAWLTIARASTTLQERAQQRLQAEARTLGQEGLGRLDLMSRALEVLASTYPSHQNLDLFRTQLGAVFQVPPDAVSLVPPSGQAIPIIGAIALPSRPNARWNISSSGVASSWAVMSVRYS